MHMDSYEAGVPSWVDVGVPDLDVAAGFYSALFGWDCPEGDPEFGGYRVCELAGRTVAGLGPQMNPGPPYWSTYVNVAGADETVAKAVAAGGQVVVPPMDVGGAGRMAFFADPVGAVIGVWQPGEHPGAGVVNEPGSFCWSELLTTDIPASIEFYGAVFGWTAETHDGPMPYTEFQVNGRSIAGMMPKPPMAPAEMPPNWGVYFAVSDTDVAVERVQELGGSLLMGPMDIEPGRFAVVADPAGAIFDVIALESDLAG
jgi:predicted enzyme related to lactoylglutathione lyase